jgi:hypothetical protein
MNFTYGGDQTTPPEWCCDASAADRRCGSWQQDGWLLMLDIIIAASNCANAGQLEENDCK